MARVRRGAAEWVRLIDEWHASGLNLSVFCRRRGLNFGTMQGWVYKSTHKEALEKARREAGAGGESTDNPPTAEAFLPIRVRDAEPEHRGMGCSGVEVILGEGRRVVIEAGFDAETLRRVVAVLEDRTC
jgi:hypothetical protein